MMNKQQIRELCANLFNAGKNSLPDKMFNDQFEFMWNKLSKKKRGKK